MHIRLGKWCPTCSRKWRMITMAQIHAMALARDGACLSTLYGNDNQRLRWRCAQGHEWLAIPSKIKGGSWCRECSQPSYTIADMRNLAKRQGAECVSQEYVNNNTKLRWRCGRGHEWSTTPAVIRRGHRCPECGWLAHCKTDAARRKYQAVRLPDTLSGEGQN